MISRIPAKSTFAPGVSEMFGAPPVRMGQVVSVIEPTPVVPAGVHVNYPYWTYPTEVITAPATPAPVGMGLLLGGIAVAAVVGFLLARK
jgi:hypothetical protein